MFALETLYADSLEYPARSNVISRYCFYNIRLSCKKNFLTFNTEESKRLKWKEGFYAKLLTAHSFLGVSGGLAMLPSDLICRELQLGLGDRSRVLAVVLIPLGD